MTKYAGTIDDIDDVATQVDDALRLATASHRGPAAVAAALDAAERPRRGFAAGAPYLVNVITDPDAAYPRSTFGV